MTIGVLLPRDFLDRQPKRWQKSQRKRGALKTLKKMQVKREKLEHRTLENARSDDSARWAVEAAAQPKLGASQELVRAAPAHAPPTAAASSCTAFGERQQGFWAAQLVPNRPLVVRIPEGAELWLLHAALSEGAGAASGPVLLRCRVPATQAVRTLCGLQSGEQESCRLSACFSAEDRQCALGAEGEHPLHLIGCYKRAATASSPVAVRTAHTVATPAAATPAVARPAAAAVSERDGGRAASAKEPTAAASVGVLRELAGGLKVVDTSLGKGMLGKKGRGARNGDQLTVRYTGLSADSQGNWVEFDSNRGAAQRRPARSFARPPCRASLPPSCAPRGRQTHAVQAGSGGGHQGLGPGCRGYGRGGK